MKQWPIITDEDRVSVLNALADDTLSSGEMSHHLEVAWASYLGIDTGRVLSYSGCTDAMTAILKAYDIGQGDEVITTAYTFQGTYFPIVYLGAIPKFVDIEPGGYNLNPDLIEAQITENTKAIIPVHIHGQPANMKAIMKLAHRYNLLVIEDACQAPGAKYFGQHIGTIGDAACFSLSISKPLGAGQGGLIVLNTHRELRKKLSQWARYGEDSTKDHDLYRPYISQKVGHNYGINEFSAALALSQLTRLDEVNQTARSNARLLTKLLANEPLLSLPQEIPDTVSTWHKYRLGLASSLDRDKVLQTLQENGISCTLWQTIPASEQPCLTRNYPNHPRTKRMLAHSIIIGDERYPMAVHTYQSILHYADTIKRVIHSSFPS